MQYYLWIKRVDEVLGKLRRPRDSQNTEKMLTSIIVSSLPASFGLILRNDPDSTVLGNDSKACLFESIRNLPFPKRLILSIVTFPESRTFFEYH